MISLLVSKPDAKVYFINVIEGDEEEEVLETQVSPVFNKDGEILNTEFEISFLVTVPALGLQSYYLKEISAEEGTGESPKVAEVRIFNREQHPFQVAPFSAVSVLDAQSFVLSNTYIKA